MTGRQPSAARTPARRVRAMRRVPRSRRLPTNRHQAPPPSAHLAVTPEDGVPCTSEKFVNPLTESCKCETMNQILSRPRKIPTHRQTAPPRGNSFPRSHSGPHFYESPILDVRIKIGFPAAIFHARKFGAVFHLGVVLVADGKNRDQRNPILPGESLQTFASGLNIFSLQLFHAINHFPRHNLACEIFQLRFSLFQGRPMPFSEGSLPTGHQTLSEISIGKVLPSKNAPIARGLL